MTQSQKNAPTATINSDTPPADAKFMAFRDGRRIISFQSRNDIPLQSGALCLLKDLRLAREIPGFRLSHAWLIPGSLVDPEKVIV